MTRSELLLRTAPFALRVVERTGGRAAILYRRRSDLKGRDRLQRIAAFSPLAYTVATPMLREAVRCHLDEERRAAGKAAPAPTVELAPGPFYALSADWGARAACFALLTAGLRDAERMLKALGHLRAANADEAAWWLGMLTREDSTRALRALRILTEAVD